MRHPFLKFFLLPIYCKWINIVGMLTSNRDANSLVEYRSFSSIIVIHLNSWSSSWFKLKFLWISLKFTLLTTAVCDSLLGYMASDILDEIHIIESLSSVTHFRTAKFFLNLLWKCKVTVHCNILLYCRLILSIAAI